MRKLQPGQTIPMVNACQSPEPSYDLIPRTMATGMTDLSQESTRYIRGQYYSQADTGNSHNSALNRMQRACQLNQS